VQVGVELGYLSAQYKALGMDSNAFLELMATIPYRLYPVLAIFAALMVCSPAVGTWLMLTDMGLVHRRPYSSNRAVPSTKLSSATYAMCYVQLAVMMRDFGPMLDAERDFARKTGASVGEADERTALLSPPDTQSEIVVDLDNMYVQAFFFFRIACVSVDGCHEH
jgi:hypothetical protein